MSVPKFALFGHPVAHTLSPRIHTAFARDLGIPMEYKAIDVQPEHLAAALDTFAESGGVGGNVTLPFKEEAAALCVELSPRARIAGAVNTLQRTDQGWHGDNTDGAGLVRDLTDRHRLDLRGRRCLLLGAGGAGRGVAPALLDAGVSALVVVNRTPAKADSLIDALGDPAHATSRYWADLGNLGEFELIINATSGARQGEKLDLPFSLAAPRFVAVDLNYGLVPVSFLAWARAAKAEAAIDGLGMLVEQAAEAFALWHGKRPHTSDIYALLHQESKALRNAN